MSPLVHSNKDVVCALVQAFRGHVRPMLRHATASSIIEFAYNERAVLAQRQLLTEELYGNTFAVCKVGPPGRRVCLERNQSGSNSKSWFSRIKPVTSTLAREQGRLADLD